MKASQFLILVFLIICNSLFCQSDYEPLIDTNKQWNILRSEWDYEWGLPEYHWLYSQKTIGERFCKAFLTFPCIEKRWQSPACGGKEWGDFFYDDE